MGNRNPPGVTTLEFHRNGEIREFDGMYVHRVHFAIEEGFVFLIEYCGETSVFKADWDWHQLERVHHVGPYNIAVRNIGYVFRILFLNIKARGWESVDEDGNRPIDFIALKVMRSPAPLVRNGVSQPTVPLTRGEMGLSRLTCG